MKKLNSYILSKQRKNSYKNIWRKDLNNIRQINYKKLQNKNSLSFFQEKDFQKNKDLNYSERIFSAQSELNTKRINSLNIKKNFEIFSSVSNYLLKKKQKINDLNKIKEIRQDNLKRLLEGSKLDQNILGKTFSMKCINDEELKNLSKAYEKGHIKKLGLTGKINSPEENKNFMRTQNKLFNKYNINPILTLKEKKYLNSIKPKSIVENIVM